MKQAHEIRLKDSEIETLKAKFREEGDSDLAVEDAMLAVQFEHKPRGRRSASMEKFSDVPFRNVRPKNAVCPPGLRTPSAGDFLRRLEAEELLCEKSVDLGSLQRGLLELGDAYIDLPENPDDPPIRHLAPFKKKLESLVEEVKKQMDVLRMSSARKAGRYRDSTLLTDLHQMERREMSHRNKNQFLNVIEDHEKICDGPPILGPHTRYHNFRPKKDTSLRGGE